MIDPATSIASARRRGTEALLCARNAAGHWTGELSSSALSTATAVCALAVFDRRKPEGAPDVRGFIDAGLRWLAANANADGGWGDTNRSISNLSTTTLVWAAFAAADRPNKPDRPDRPYKISDAFRGVVDGAERWLRVRTGGLEPARLARAIAKLYGKDRTFSIPILTLCAIAGRLGPERTAWRHVVQLPFELAALPSRWFGAIRLPVVSYALPALIAVGQVRHFFRPTRNPVTRLLRMAARNRTLRVLESIQPENGGFLEATPLTSFVTMSLAAMGLTENRVVRRGVEFLIQSARPDGSWAIDTNLATWLTTLSVNALPADALNAEERSRIRAWLLGQQYRAVHPYTNAAPGGWAWTNLPGGVPDADDTAGALLALRRLGPVDAATFQAASAGARWLMDLQNADGGIPTFCKGWGTLPFDRSSPDITAHAVRAWLAWREDFAKWAAEGTAGGGAGSAPTRHALDQAIWRALEFLRARQRPDGSWVPLWFGHQHAADEENPVYGTARVLLALEAMERAETMAASRDGTSEGENALEESERSLNCHPELAKDLTACQTAQCQHSAFSKLRASLGEPSAPMSQNEKVTPIRLREILRKLPMNLPVGDRRSAPTARPHTSLGQRPTAIKLSLEALVTRARSQAPAWECSIPGGSSLLPDLQKHSAPEGNGRLEPPRQGRSQAGAWERDRESERSLNCHPELAKDPTACQTAPCHHSAFSKLRASLGEPSAPMSQNEKVTPIRLREILRKLRMTANKALFPSVSPVREFACTKKAFPLAAMTASGRRWLIEHQNADGGWSGAAGSPSSVEETAVALEALAALEIHGGGENPQPVPDCVHPALEAGARWLAGHLNSNAPLEPAPIGFYFARLWYYERLYPLIFAVAALR